jgi:mannose/fructose-specific phosphotransferase system component IIA
MTLRDALGIDVPHVYERVDEVLNSEDGIILLVDAWG